MKRIVAIAALLLVAFALGAQTVSVVTINAWSGLTEGGVFRVQEYEDSATRAFRFDLLANGLEQLDADIVAVQEANPLPRFVSDLTAALAYDSTHHVRQGGVRIGPVGLPTNLREGAVLLVKSELAMGERLRSQLTGAGAGNVAAFQLRAASQVIGVPVTVGERTVYVFTTRWTPSPAADRGYLSTLVERYDDDQLQAESFIDAIQTAVHGSEVRAQEARRTLTYINQQAGEAPVILMGSFHAAPDSDEIQMLRDAGFVDVFAAVGSGPGYTHDSVRNSNIVTYELVDPQTPVRERVDYIFVRGSGIRPRTARVIFDTPTYGVHLSDHFGIFAELLIEPAP